MWLEQGGRQPQVKLSEKSSLRNNLPVPKKSRPALPCRDRGNFLDWISGELFAAPLVRNF